MLFLGHFSHKTIIFASLLDFNHWTIFEVVSLLKVGKIDYDVLDLSFAQEKYINPESNKTLVEKILNKNHSIFLTCLDAKHLRELMLTFNKIKVRIKTSYIELDHKVPIITHSRQKQKKVCWRLASLCYLMWTCLEWMMLKTMHHGLIHR